MSMFLGRRNRIGLTVKQIEYCLLAWAVVCGDKPRTLLIDEAHLDGSRTRFVENREVIYLGADVYSGYGTNANSRMSVLACLTHEFSHAERFTRGYRRPIDMPDVLIDEAETSLDATFHIALSQKDREDLIEDARDRLTEWLAIQSGGGEK